MKIERTGDYVDSRYSSNMATLVELENEVLQLPEEQRIALINRVLKMSESAAESDANSLWKDEILRRIELLDQGLTERSPASDVFRQLDQQWT